MLGADNNNLLNADKISEKILVPVNYLEQILLQLKRNGYVQSKRGVNGDYKLSRNPRKKKLQWYEIPLSSSNKQYLVF